MTRMQRILAGVSLALALGFPSPAIAQTSLATAAIPAGLSANGQSLPAGTYSLRVTTDAVPPVVGQGPEAAKWVEFLQGGQVKGKELASVVAPADVQAVAKRTPPAQGRALVQGLRGADYVRVWVNQAGTQYLIHLSKATSTAAAR
jgi:hypothetical protein